MPQSNLGFSFMTSMKKYNCHKNSLHDAEKALFVKRNQLTVFVSGKLWEQYKSRKLASETPL